MGVAVDTSVLVRRITNDDPVRSPQAIKMLKDAATDSLLLDRLIIEELGFVLRSQYGYTKEQVTEVYQALTTESIFTILDRDLVELTVALFATEKPLSFEDCWLLALKRAGKVSDVATFDDNLRKRLT